MAIICFWQIILVQLTGRAFYVAALDAEQWMWCVFFGFTELLWGQVVVSIPKTILSKRLRFFSSGIADKDLITPIASDSSGRVLWLRGLTRLQHQVPTLPIKSMWLFIHIYYATLECKLRGTYFRGRVWSHRMKNRSNHR